MEEQKTLLQQIAAKEAQLSLSLEQAAKEAESIVSRARRQAEEITGNAEAMGKESAKEYYRKEKEETERQVSEIKARGNAEALALRKKAEENMPAAVEVIVRNVALE
jgi:vacuolar-type H+-ATPase subunit H